MHLLQGVTPVFTFAALFGILVMFSFLEQKRSGLFIVYYFSLECIVDLRRGTVPAVVCGALFTYVKQQFVEYLFRGNAPLTFGLKGDFYSHL